MDITDELEKALNGRWVTADKKSAFFFASSEDEDGWGFMTIQQPSLPLVSFEFKVSRQDNRTYIIYRSRETINERALEIISITTNSLIIVTDGKPFTLSKA